jgi:HPt (histidine-containing phosphotransfer) domain-containing protein
MENNNKHINLTYLKELSNGSNEFICQMISVFIAQTPEMIANMEEHLHKQDWKALHAVAHRMKPSFSFMGIKELETTIHTLEEYCLKKTNLDQIPDMLSTIKHTCEIAIKELEVEKKAFT